MIKSIIVIAEMQRHEISPLVYELISCAHILHQGSGALIQILLAGHDVFEPAQKLARQTGHDVLLIPLKNQDLSLAEIYKSIEADFFLKLNPLYICMPHNAFGFEIAAGLAVKLDAACISGVEAVILQHKNILFHRKIFHDKVVANLISNTEISVLMIQPGAFRPVHPQKTVPGKVQIVHPGLSYYPVKHLGYASQPHTASALSEAEVVVCAGHGIADEKNLGLIHQLAGLFPKSCVAGSRPVCDRQWLPYSHQVGATGAAVKPKLYIACGISGSSQHVAGMRDSKFIVSINTDPNAAIFQYSDVCVIEDLTAFIPELIHAYQNPSSP